MPKIKVSMNPILVRGAVPLRQPRVTIEIKKKTKK